MRGSSYADKNGKNPPKGQPTEARTSKRRTSTGGEPADWSAVDPVLLAAAIAAVTRDGSAIRFGYTRDLGAYAIGFYENGESNTEYVPPSEDMSLWLTGVIEDYGK